MVTSFLLYRRRGRAMIGYSHLWVTERGRNYMRIRTPIVATLIAISIISDAAPAAENVARRPNVIIIVADDLGNGDLGVQGAKDLRTPHVDSLAANGVRF